MLSTALQGCYAVDIIQLKIYLRCNTFFEQPIKPHNLAIFPPIFVCRELHTLINLLLVFAELAYFVVYSASNHLGNCYAIPPPFLSDI